MVTQTYETHKEFMFMGFHGCNSAAGFFYDTSEHNPTNERAHVPLWCLSRQTDPAHAAKLVSACLHSITQRVAPTDYTRQGPWTQTNNVAASIRTFSPVLPCAPSSKYSELDGISTVTHPTTSSARHFGGRIARCAQRLCRTIPKLHSGAWYEEQ